MAAQNDVARELLALGFRSYRRSVVTGFAFAAFIVAFMWPDIPHDFLLAWLFAVGLTSVARLTIAHEFNKAGPPDADLPRWTRLGAIGYGSIGLCWGVIGAASLHYAQARVEYAMVICFLIVIFSVLQSRVAAAHSTIFESFLICAWSPILIAAITEPSPNWVLRLVLLLLLVVTTTLVGRAGNRAVAESLQIRYENLELLEDITRQKEELTKANHAKTRFFAAASHDLRQPMQAIVLLVESLRERVTEPESRRIVASIHSSVNSMAALVNALLDISRFDAGTVKPERSHFRVGTVLERLRGNFAEEAVGKGLEFRVHPSTAIVASDHILLYRILANITSNAIRYTERGRVVLGCRRRPDGIEVGVWDTGPGIPEDDLEDVFKEFHQLGNPHRDREQGLGLGLAIVERTAALLGHPLVVRSRVGHGSLFAIRVPYGDLTGIQATERARGSEWTSLEGCRVLVVEDEREIRGAMVMLLESWGCEVTAAPNGAEARAWLARTTSAPDVVIADYRLPGEDSGIAIVRLVQSLHGASGILVTGDIAPELLKDAESSGIRLLHKPLRPARLRSLLGNVWRERSAPQRPTESAAA
jgi:signal transduction histidine kinase